MISSSLYEHHYLYITYSSVSKRSTLSAERTREYWYIFYEHHHWYITTSFIPTSRTLPHTNTIIDISRPFSFQLHELFLTRTPSLIHHDLFHFKFTNSFSHEHHHFYIANSIILIWVATISMLLKIISHFCKRALSKKLYSAQETYNFEEPTNRSHRISSSHSRRHNNLFITHFII